MNADSLHSIKDIHNRKIVGLIYRTMLGRDPDIAGLAHYSKVLQDGESAGKIIKTFQASDEYIKRTVSASQFEQMRPSDELRGMGPHAIRMYLALQSEMSKKKENHLCGS